MPGYVWADCTCGCMSTCMSMCMSMCMCANESGRVLCSYFECAPIPCMHACIWSYFASLGDDIPAKVKRYAHLEATLQLRIGVHTTLLKMTLGMRFCHFRTLKLCYEMDVVIVCERKVRRYVLLVQRPCRHTHTQHTCDTLMLVPSRHAHRIIRVHW